MTEVLLIRPGCTAFDEQERVQGDLDLPLSERGEVQVQAILAEFREHPPEVVFASPCEPARSIAERLGRESGIKVKVLDELRNLHFGLWQGLQLDDIRRKHPRVWKQWEESPESVCPPEGETVSEAQERIAEALRKPLRKWSRPAIVVPEPLATLVHAHLTGTYDVGEVPLCCGPEATNRMQRIHLSEDGTSAWTTDVPLAAVPPFLKVSGETSA